MSDRIAILERKLAQSKEHIKHKFNELEQINMAWNKQSDDYDTSDNQEESEKVQEEPQISVQENGSSFQYQEIDSYEKLENFVSKLINSSTERKPVADTIIDILPYFELSTLQNMSIIDQKAPSAQPKKLLYYKDFDGFIYQNLQKAIRE